MRPARIIATVMVVAAVAVAGCTAHSTAVPPAAAPPVAPASPVATVPTPTGPTDSEPVVLADGRHPVVLKAVDARRGRVTFDVVQFYRGEEATIEAAKDHQEALNDHYVRNVNPRLRTLRVRTDAAVTVNALVGTQKSVPVTLAKLATLTRTSGAMFWVTVRNDQVVRIAEQWSP
jgi:hypothetical protein